MLPSRTTASHTLAAHPTYRNPASCHLILSFRHRNNQTPCSECGYNVAMGELRWKSSHAVFITEIDDEHEHIFLALAELQKVLGCETSPAAAQKATARLAAVIEEHFAHEERLMRAALYDGFDWHREKHTAALRRVRALVERIEAGGDPTAAQELVKYLTAWLHRHTRLEDRMLGAFLRNHRRCAKMTFRAGTKPLGACNWVQANGEPLNLETAQNGF